MKNSKNLLPTIKQADDIAKKMQSWMMMRTPAQFVKKRPDGYDYVEIGYVKAMLNQAVSPLGWSYKTTEIGDWDIWFKLGQVSVKVDLTIKVPYEGQWIEVTKSGYGSSRVKKHANEYYDKKERKYKPNPKAGQLINLGSDLKSAESDAIKKAASSFGIAFDVFHPKTVKDYQIVLRQQQAKTTQEANLETEKNNKAYYIRSLFALAQELWATSDKEQIKSLVKKHCDMDIPSISEATEQQLGEAVERMQMMKDKRNEILQP